MKKAAFQFSGLLCCAVLATTAHAASVTQLMSASRDLAHPDYNPADWRATEALCSPSQRAAARASSFGCYRGYSAATYDSFVRQSLYVAMPDGVRLAVDVFRPAIGGKVVEKPLPVIFNYSRYWRADEFSNGVVNTAVGTIKIGQSSSSIDAAIRARSAHPEAIERNERPDNKGYGLFLAHGYVVVKAEARGTGASFGNFNGDMSGVEARDGHDLVQWAAAQPWSNGKVGMVGQSYEGMEQYLVASTAPPNLIAAFPNVGTFDEYRVAWAGTGVLRKYGIAYLTYVGRRDGTTKGTKDSKVNAAEAVTKEVGRVDEDPDGTMRTAARAERQKNPDAANPFTYFMRQSPGAVELYQVVGKSLGTTSPTEILETVYSTERLEAQLTKDPGLRARLSQIQHYRDGADVMVAPQVSGPNNLAVLAGRVRNSGIKILNWGSWLDYQSTDQVLWQGNLGPSSKLVMGPWTHNQNEPKDVREDASHTLRRIEQLRWMDRWLKGVANGIDAEPAVKVAASASETEFSWFQSSRWPLPDAPRRHWMIGERHTLGTAAKTAGSVAFVVDYHSTLGEHTRYHDAIGLGPIEYPDLDAHAKRGAVAFTTPANSRPTLLIGAPVVSLWVTASTADADVHAVLERIDVKGRATYLSDGVLRASHRVLGRAPYDNLGLPWSDSSRAVVARTQPLTQNKPVKLQFDLQPIGIRLLKGERLRLVITGADANTNLTIPQSPATVLSVHFGAGTPSELSIPALRQ